ncbi:RNA-binding protein [Candidatus Sumerlaeota bacterium]|nr:RNA-binding protein [Candidatus Sumerlaeota bacterium]
MSKKIYVGNIPFQTTEEEVRTMFGRYGEVHKVNIITDRDTGRSRGFCFVEMDGADEAIAELNGKDFGGRSLRVNEAREREGGGHDRGDRGGDRGGGRGDRGDRGGRGGGRSW